MSDQLDLFAAAGAGLEEEPGAPAGVLSHDWEMVNGHNYGYDRTQYPPEAFAEDVAEVVDIAERQARYDERRAARLERLEDRAERARADAAGTLQRARDMADVIPFGQPILVGHYSERRDRRYRDRIDSTFRRSFELAEKAERLERRAAGAGTAGISADDPSAVAQLRQKLERLEQKQETMKRRNAIIKRAKHPDDAAAELVRGEGMYAPDAVALVEPDFAGRRGYPAYAVTNNGAEIRRCRARIAELEAREASAPAEGGSNDAGVTWGEDRELNRVWIEYPGKPDEATRAALKSAGFRWAPSLKRWQRQTSNAAIYHARRLTTTD